MNTAQRVALMFLVIVVATPLLTWLLIWRFHS